MQNSSVFWLVNTSLFTKDDIQICLLCKLYQVGHFKSFPVNFGIGIRIELMTIQTIWIMIDQILVIMC